MSPRKSYEASGSPLQFRRFPAAVKATTANVDVEANEVSLRGD